MCDMAYIARLTRCSAEDRESLARYYAGLPDAGRVEVHRAQSGLFRQHGAKKKPGRRPEFFYAMLVLALHRIHNTEFQIESHRKGNLTGNIDAEQIRKIRVFGEQKKGSPPAAAKVIVAEHYGLISRLREQKTSWREISRHLDMRYKKKIGYLSLQKNFEKITTDWKNADAGRFSPGTSARLAGYFADLSDKARIGIVRSQLDLIRTNREKFSKQGRAEVFYTMFLMALHKACNAKAEESAEGMPGTPPDLPVGPRKKTGPKKEKLDKHLYDQVKKLREEGWTWSRIARNLAQYKRLKIGAVWLRQSFKQITEERKARGEA